MRFICILFLVCCIAYACVKPQSKDPVPSGEFKSFVAYKKADGLDTAILTLSYVDGDGDLFLDDASQGPNVSFVPFYYNETTGTYSINIDPITKDTVRITSYVFQPADDYYKGRSIKGDIIIPMKEFRPNNNVKIIKYVGFLKDIKGNRSNTISVPAYTVTF